MAYAVMAYAVTAYVVMAYAVMACTVMAYVVMAFDVHIVHTSMVLLPSPVKHDPVAWSTDHRLADHAACHSASRMGENGAVVRQ